MELHEANRILRSVKSALYADGTKLPPSADADGLMMLLEKIDCDKLVSTKVKHAKTAPTSRANAPVMFFRALQAVKKGMPDPVVTVAFMRLNGDICGDIDEEAGKPRRLDTDTGGNAHTDPKYINGSLKSVISKMNEIPAAPAISKEDFAGYLTHYMRELLIMHPFTNASEFTVRIFLMIFCKLKGFSLCYYRAPVSDLKNAETAAFVADDITPLYKIFAACLSYDHIVSAPKEQRTAQTRREISSKVRKEQDAGIVNELTKVKLKALEARKDEKPEKDNDDVLKRAIKLQQKITRLNEQLAELMIQSKEEKKSKAQPVRSNKAPDKNTKR